MSHRKKTMDKDAEIIEEAEEVHSEEKKTVSSKKRSRKSEQETDPDWTAKSEQATDKKREKKTRRPSRSKSKEKEVSSSSSSKPNKKAKRPDSIPEETTVDTKITVKDFMASKEENTLPKDGTVPDSTSSSSLTLKPASLETLSSGSTPLVSSQEPSSETQKAGTDSTEIHRLTPVSTPVVSETSSVPLTLSASSKKDSTGVPSSAVSQVIGTNSTSGPTTRASSETNGSAIETASATSPSLPVEYTSTNSITNGVHVMGDEKKRMGEIFQEKLTRILSSYTIANHGKEDAEIVSGFLRPEVYLEVLTESLEGLFSMYLEERCRSLQESKIGSPESIRLNKHHNLDMDKIRKHSQHITAWILLTQELDKNPMHFRHDMIGAWSKVLRTDARDTTQDLLLKMEDSIRYSFHPARGNGGRRLVATPKKVDWKVDTRDPNLVGLTNSDSLDKSLETHRPRIHPFSSQSRNLFDTSDATPTSTSLVSSTSPSATPSSSTSTAAGSSISSLTPTQSRPRALNLAKLQSI